MSQLPENFSIFPFMFMKWVGRTFLDAILLHLITLMNCRFTVGNKRARLSAETDHDTGSESSPGSPRHKSKSFSMPLSMSPIRHQASPSSPESDLDVDDSAPDEATPENLSLKKKERSKSPAGNNNFNNNMGFLPYPQPYHQPNVSTSPTQRSPVDVLLRCVHDHYLMLRWKSLEFCGFSPCRVFPNRRRSEVEQLLTRYRGDVVQAMEAMLCGDDAMSQIS